MCKNTKTNSQAHSHMHLPPVVARRVLFCAPQDHFYFLSVPYLHGPVHSIGKYR